MTNRLSTTKRARCVLATLLGAAALLCGALLRQAPAVAADAKKDAKPVAVAPLPTRTIDFVKDVQPIFEAACYKCHGAEKHKGELRMDAKALALKGGTTGPLLVPGEADRSLLVQRLLGLGDEERMPAKADPLAPEQIAVIKAWINQGAKWPDSATVAGATLKRHWSYAKPARPELPAVKDAGWSRTPVDRYILARLEKEGLQPSPEASKETLIRRLSLDLTGLPPTLSEVEAFAADASPEAYDRLVDRLLASPHYGERWARPWLDLARYADSNGFEKDGRRTMWRYRDWVIDALNANLSFAQFTVEQLAGDMLPNATVNQQVATGFHRNTMLNEEGGVDREEQRWLTLVDRVGTTAQVWLGTTMQCSQCHNHKYDPFSQREFYELLAFFDNADEPSINVVEKGEAATKPQPAGAKPAKKADDKHNAALVMRERAGKGRPATDLRIRGSFLTKGERVEADVPNVLPPLPAGEPANRLTLARWLVSDDNPLTARVTANRIWEQYFGHGIVETLDDFGTQGEAPTHPELLDWLATEFVRLGWDMKAVHRLIVTSATYRQSSRVPPILLERDPYNRLLARGPRFRMEAEMLRDVALSVAGQLSSKVGGPSVMPPQPEGIWNIPYSGDKWVQSAGEDAFRRGIYTFWRRSAPYPTFMNFDAPSREFCTVRRLRTNTPLQALSILNDPAFFDAAKALARRMLAEAPTADSESRVACGFRLCTSRQPRPGELNLLTELFTQTRTSYRSDVASAATLVGSAKLPPGVDAPELAAWTVVANVLLNMDETVTKE